MVASAIVSATTSKGLSLQMPELVHEVMGSGLEGVIGGQKVRAGSQQLISVLIDPMTGPCGPCAGLPGAPL